MTISDNVYKFFADLIFKYSGLLYTPNDYYRLDSRINTLKKRLEFETIEELYSAFLTGPDEKMKELLVDLATNNETYFFRDSKPFEALEKELVPRALQRELAGKVNIWCAGCSTGQEPYSIAMGLKENCHQLNFNDLQIDASDICSEALSKARSGRYTTLETQRGLPEKMLQRHFTERDGGFEISQAIKSKIRFFPFNLINAAFPARKYDVIFCRNVLIYHSRENRLKVLTGLAQALKPGGSLILGSGESLIGFDVPLKQEMVKNTMVFTREAVSLKVAS